MSRFGTIAIHLTLWLVLTVGPIFAAKPEPSGEMRLSAKDQSAAQIAPKAVFPTVRVVSLETIERISADDGGSLLRKAIAPSRGGRGRSTGQQCPTFDNSHQRSSGSSRPPTRVFKFGPVAEHHGSRLSRFQIGQG